MLNLKKNFFYDKLIIIIILMNKICLDIKFNNYLIYKYCFK